MTNDAINTYIHERIMGGLEHQLSQKATLPNGWRCDKCHTWRLTKEAFTFPCRIMSDGEVVIPDYCSDASPRRLLNEVVAKVDVCKVSMRLSAVTGRESAGYIFNSYTVPLATAEQIARACVEAHKQTSPSSDTEEDNDE